MPRSRHELQMRAPRKPQTAEADWFAFRNISDDEAEIDIYGQIGGWSWFDDEENVTAKGFRRQLKDLKGKKRIIVHINSPGGSVFEGLAIYNALKQHESEIKVVVDALAASAASFIAMAADEGQLIMARNAVMMIHDASTYGGGNAADFREIADVLDMHSDNIADIYSQRSSEPATFWRAAMKEETWYTGTEAVAAGLADGVLEDADKEAEEAAAKFDLSIYNYAGRDQAPSPSVIHKRIKSEMTKAKESTMSGGTSTPKAHGDGTGTPAEGTETPAEGTETPAEGTETPAEGTPAETPAEGTETPAEEPQPAEDKTGTGPENKATMGVLINGVRVTDPVKIQNHIDALTTAQDEARTEGRKAFIKSLAEGNSPKIAASQITATELFALDLDDDKWNAWVKTWDAAPGNPLFAKHGGGTSNHDGAGSTPANEREAEIEKLEAIVNFHRQSGKTKEQIESMQSWQKLQQLKPSTES